MDSLGESQSIRVVPWHTNRIFVIFDSLFRKFPLSYHKKRGISIEIFFSLDGEYLDESLQKKIFICIIIYTCCWGFERTDTIHTGRYIMKNKKYYAAYEERYKTAHEQGVSWASNQNSPIVLEIIKKYNIQPEHELLEIGCGEGRDSRAILENGYHLMATDISREAVAYCKKTMPEFKEHFSVLDCLSDHLDELFDFIYGIAVIHMLVLDEDRDGFYQFIYNHLKSDGLALICTMGDGEFEMQSDISRAFEIQERNHESGTMMVAGTSCRMVSFKTFDDELSRNGLKVIEKGITSALPEFSSLMFAVVQKK